MITKLVFSLLLCGATYSHADQIYIDVGKAQAKQSLLALPAFQYFGADAAQAKNIEAGQTLYKTVFNDLSVSGYFNFIKQEAFLEDPNKVGLKPAPGEENGFDFKKWKTIGTEFLIRGGYRVTGSKLSFEVYVYHVPQAKLIFGRTYEGTLESARKVAHTFANDLLKNLTGQPGMFLTKIVLSANRDKKDQKEIFIMDWDGENIQKMTTHQSISVSPAWSANANKIAYTSFAYHKNAKMRNADLFTYDLKTGQRFLVSYRKGINSGAAFSPDDKYLYLTISQGGHPDIYRMTLDGKTLLRITDGPAGAMNVEPAISPDGSKIAFSSDRSGRPMVYVMNLDGTGLKRLTFAGRYNATPTWSPDGKKIAFAGYDSNHFDIFIMNVDGTGLKRLTDATMTGGRAANNEDPTFSPDGRHVMFISNRTGNNQVYIVSPDGTNERRITYDKFDYFKPKWSPLVD